MTYNERMSARSAEKYNPTVVRALIFDLDGTLIDSKADLVQSVNAALRNSGRDAISGDAVTSFVGAGAGTLIRRAMEKAAGKPATDAEVSDTLAFFLRYYGEHMLDNTVLYPGVLPALEQLAAHPMAVLTNKPVRFSRAILEGLGVDRYFRFVYGGNSFETKKPDPMGAHAVAREFGVLPSEVMVVGDSDVDVLTARNAGMWACAVTYGLGLAGLRDTPPDLLIDNLTELPLALGKANLLSVLK
jgi:phosphoglycolate phosphatase